MIFVNTAALCVGNFLSTLFINQFVSCGWIKREKRRRLDETGFSVDALSSLRPNRSQMLAVCAGSQSAALRSDQKGVECKYVFLLKTPL